ncbi:nuclear transport factor 2 family protein [Marinobacteraceae bacterium S3BR75-40.1]
MFQTLTRQKVLKAFDYLSSRDVEGLLRGCSETIHHEFAGNHALGGVRNSKKAFGLWLERLFLLFPHLTFEPHSVFIHGPPWNMRVCVTWTDRGITADGEDYENTGVHELRIRRGKVHSLKAHLDTQHLAAVLQRMAAKGVAEADAQPIEEGP